MAHLTNLLAHHIRTHGPISTCRVSSAQSSTQYSYWGAVRYQIRLTADGRPANCALERASSDRRSTRLAERDCEELADREGRMVYQGIGRLSEAGARNVLAEIGGYDEALGRHDRRQVAAVKPLAIAERLARHKRIRRAQLKEARLLDLQRAGYAVRHSTHSKWNLPGTYDWSVCDPGQLHASYSCDFPPTVAEAAAGIAAEVQAQADRAWASAERRAEWEARHHADYAAATALPEGRVVFDAEGGFRIESDN